MGSSGALSYKELDSGLETCWNRYRELVESLSVKDSDAVIRSNEAKCSFMQLCSQVRLIASCCWRRVWGDCGGLGFYGFDDSYVNVTTSEGFTYSVIGMNEKGEVFVVKQGSLEELDLLHLDPASLKELAFFLLDIMKEAES